MQFVEFTPHVLARDLALRWQPVAHCQSSGGYAFGDRVGKTAIDRAFILDEAEILKHAGVRLRLTLLAHLA